MSDHWIILVPEDPDFVPSEEAQARATALFRSIASGADEVKAETSDRIHFVDCGGNFERVVCPICSEEVPMSWWTPRIHHELDAHCPLEAIELPCCGAVKALNQLVYEYPQAFGRFSLEAMNPNIGELPDEEFESILGCRLTVVYRHL